jgi:hypothetical protein
VQEDFIVESASSLLDTDNKYEYLQKKNIKILNSNKPLNFSSHIVQNTQMNVNRQGTEDLTTSLYDHIKVFHTKRRIRQTKIKSKNVGTL